MTRKMRIGIVTVYESTTNLGSYLQAYALKKSLENMGHEVFMVQNVPTMKSAKECALKLNPKRQIFLRLKRTGHFISDVKKLNLLYKDDILNANLDCLIYGSDEIWNLDNPYFCNELFYGGHVENITRIAYAVSAGAVSDTTIDNHPEFGANIQKYEKIMVRDERTHRLVKDLTGYECEYVCDPTILLPLEYMKKAVRRPRDKYIAVYTYGVDQPVIDIIQAFARKKNLKVVSVFFWHPWADQVVECSPLQFSEVLAGAEYVFTTTFHGAIFTLLNHKKCCILPLREKVKDVVERLHQDEHLIDSECTKEMFFEVMERPFDSEKFEIRVKEFRSTSLQKLEGALKCLKK